ncbi:MAG: hypothetical protein Q7S45_00145 [Candidatus Curtissbacteria bacterium]|nr:hypothetical protein [Candidatus Curtissbacteria bacterium]
MTPDREEQTVVERNFSSQVTLHGKGASIAIDDSAGMGYMGPDKLNPHLQKFVVVKHLRRTAVHPPSIRKAETEGAQWVQFFVSVRVGEKKPIGEKYEFTFENLDRDSVTISIRSANPIVTSNLPRFAGLTSTLKNIHRETSGLTSRHQTT